MLARVQGSLPRNNLIIVVEEPKSRVSPTSHHGIEDVRDTLFRSQACFRATHIGANRARTHQGQTARVFGVPRGLRKLATDWTPIALADNCRRLRRLQVA